VAARLHKTTRGRLDSCGEENLKTARGPPKVYGSSGSGGYKNQDLIITQKFACAIHRDERICVL